MATKVRVSISSTGISVDQDPVKINNNTSVDWEGGDATAFNIVFPQGGGRVKSSGVGASGKYVVSSDNFSNTTGNPKKVKYDVKSGSLHLDPDIEIQP